MTSDAPSESHQAKDVAIIVNPTSGRGRGLRTAEAVAFELRNRGVEVAILHTGATGDAERIAREIAVDPTQRPDCIVGCGGDGTLQEVANALASLRVSLGESCPVMGLAPAGRCNDLGRALGVSRNPAAIANILTGGRVQPIDLGKVNDRYFCTVATVGIDAEVTNFVDSMRMPLTGTPAYLYGAMRVLARYRPHLLRITGDFGEIHQRVFLASSANTASYGGAIPIAPGAVPTDGWLDLCVIDEVSRLRALALVATVMRGRHVGRPGVRLLRTKRLTIESDESLELWADGERIGQTPATIEVAPGALRMMLPKSFGGSGRK